MTAFQHSIVNCDGNVAPGCLWWADLGQVSIREALTLVRRAGWGRVRVDGSSLDLCPECLAVHRASRSGKE